MPPAAQLGLYVLLGFCADPSEPTLAFLREGSLKTQDTRPPHPYHAQTLSWASWTTRG